jgi:hypothetical protein
MRNMRKGAVPLGWIALGWTLAALYILGPRTALNRGLDVGYSLAAWFSSLI